MLALAFHGVAISIVNYRSCLAATAALLLASGLSLAAESSSGPGARLLPRASESGGVARPETGPDRLVFRDGDHAVLEFQARPTLPPGVPEIYRRGGYVAKIMTPSGRVVSDDFPTNHIHHHGIWAAWTKTVFEGRHPDFWNMGDGKGRVEYLNVDVATATRVQSRQRYVDMTIVPEKAVLEETFEVELRPSLTGPRPAHVFDVTLKQSCVTASPLQLSKYLYGGLGFRGNHEWNGAGNCQFLTSEGIGDRQKAHATQARWCHISGLVEGQRAGIAILCHPGNFRAPQPMRIHPDEPFFCYAPPAGGEFSIQPGTPYVARYRCVVFDGEPDQAWLDELWQQFRGTTE